MVDTLLDIQIDEAPLIIKKGNQGERCASCSQNIGFVNHCHDRNEHSGDKVNFSSSVTNINLKKYNKDMKNPSLAENAEEFLIISKLGKNVNASSLIANNLPEINNNSILYNNKNVKSKRKKTVEIVVNSGKNTSSMFGKNSSTNNSNFHNSQLDENSEKQLSSMINSELEKNIINPDNIMRATKRVYDSYDKKNK